MQLLAFPAQVRQVELQARQEVPETKDPFLHKLQEVVSVAEQVVH